MSRTFKPMTDACQDLDAWLVDMSDPFAQCIAMRIRTISFILAVALAVGVMHTTNGSEPAVASGYKVSIVGDSLVASREKLYEDALVGQGFDAEANGVGSRALRYGWQCRINGSLRVVAKPVDSKCRREGLEQIRYWAQRGELGEVVVIALGTNDAGLFTAKQTAGNLSTVRSIVRNREIKIVSVAALGSRNKRMKAWNEAAATWCAADTNCVMVPWAESAYAKAKTTYSSDGIHLTVEGTKHRAAVIAATVAGL